MDWPATEQVSCHAEFARIAIRSGKLLIVNDNRSMGFRNWRWRPPYSVADEADELVRTRTVGPECLSLLETFWLGALAPMLMVAQPDAIYTAGAATRFGQFVGFDVGILVVAGNVPTSIFAGDVAE